MAKRKKKSLQKHLRKKKKQEKEMGKDGIKKNVLNTSDK